MGMMRGSLETGYYCTATLQRLIHQTISRKCMIGRGGGLVSRIMDALVVDSLRYCRFLIKFRDTTIIMIHWQILHRRRGEIQGSVIFGRPEYTAMGGKISFTEKHTGFFSSLFFLNKCI